MSEAVLIHCFANSIDAAAHILPVFSGQAKTRDLVVQIQLTLTNSITQREITTRGSLLYPKSIQFQDK